MEKLTFLGLSADTIKVLSDLTNDIFQLIKFDVVQNINLPEKENELKNTFYKFSVYQHHNYTYPETSYLLGVSSSYTKATVFNFFKQEYHIEET